KDQRERDAQRDEEREMETPAVPEHHQRHQQSSPSLRCTTREDYGPLRPKMVEYEPSNASQNPFMRILKALNNRDVREFPKWVRDEPKHLLDDDEDMTQLYLTRNWLQNQLSEGLLGGFVAFILCRYCSLLQNIPALNLKRLH
ncbi:hypothetical protein M8C21_028666, partial [Ambrosia artemisiifolia]